MRNSRGCKGSATIEMLYIMPVIFLILSVAIYLGFFFHDKNVIQGIVYEAVVIGHRNYRMTGEINQGELETFIYEKGEVRLLFFKINDVEIEEITSEITISVVVEKNQMSIQATQSQKLSLAEEEMRDGILVNQIVEEGWQQIWEVIINGN